MRGYTITNTQILEAVVNAYKMAKIDRSEDDNSIPNELYIVLADVGGYINVNIEIDAPDLDPIPPAILRGAVVPMLAARLAAGMRTVTSMTEGGDSVTFKQSISSEATGYKSILAPFKRLGVLGG